MAINARKIVQDAKAIPPRALSLEGLDSVESLNQMRGKVLEPFLVGGPFFGCNGDRPLKLRRTRGWVGPGVDDRYCVKTVVQSGAQVLKCFTKEDGQLVGDRFPTFNPDGPPASFIDVDSYPGWAVFKILAEDLGKLFDVVLSTTDSGPRHGQFTWRLHAAVPPG